MPPNQPEDLNDTQMLENTAAAVRNGNVDLAAHVIRKEGEKCNMLYGQLSKFHLEALTKNGQKVKASLRLPLHWRVVTEFMFPLC